jgi:enoyl-CoA hydratase/carnithine racemase
MNPAAETPTRPKLVEFEKKGAVALLTMNDPPANNYTYEMMRDLDEAVLEARFDDEIEVLVLSGAGEKFFSSGANIKMLASVTPRFKYFFCLHANETLLRLEHTPKLVIAALNGHTVGGGLEIALACDLRVARKGAGKIGLPEVNLGVLPGTGGTQRLARAIGKSKAIEWMATGQLFDFDEGERAGLVNRQVDAASADEFREKVVEYARTFATPGKAAMAVGHIKRSVQTGAEIPLEAALALERELQAKLFASADAKEGLTAYTQKRNPKFKAQ